MAQGKLKLQANDGKVAGIVFEDGAATDVTVTVPKEGGEFLTTEGAQTKNGVITFVDSPIVPAPINNGDAVNKEYVDTGAGAAFVANDTRAKTALNATGDAPIYACRAWVNFNGTGTVAIRASGNVSSITDNGVGSYTVNFATAMPDVNYSAVRSSGSMGALSGSVYHTCRFYDVLTSSIKMNHYDPNLASYDTDFISVNIQR